MIGDGFLAVLEEARGGAESAFAVLYRDLNPAVLRYFGAHARAAADDLAAETWLAAARGIASFQGDERAFRAWLFTIAHRRLVQHWRDEGRRPPQAAGEDALATRPAAEDTELAALSAAGAGTAARLIADLLPTDQANVVLLRVVAGLSVEEAARVLGKRPGTVRVLQHRALRRLAREFAVEAVTL